MNSCMIDEIRRITVPYSNTWEHVQGPGGNTSVKGKGTMLIKASGYTFKNIDNGIGLVWVNNDLVKGKLAERLEDNLAESIPANVLGSIPEGLRPSMEFEFHAVLGKYVLHTHSIYVNVVTCCTDSSSILNHIFPDTPFVFVPYIKPGHPLASFIYKKILGGETANIYFLKNHGIIVHADSIEEVVSQYNFVQQCIIDHLSLNSTLDNALNNDLFFSEINSGFERMSIKDIRDCIIVPDQSIFFRDKISDVNSLADVYFDVEKQKISINGSAKFMVAAISMLRMIYYVISNHERLSLVSEFISKSELDLLHQLSSEKFRGAIL